MNLESLQLSIKDYAKDIRINLKSVLDEQGSPGLSNRQIALIGLGVAYTTKNEQLIGHLEQVATELLSATEIEASKTASVLMGMNNIYYRFVHLSEDKEFSSMPAKLRMQGINQHGINKADFELICLAISAVNGCGLCIKSHVQQIKHEGTTNEAIQSSVRIASVLNSAAQALAIN